MPPGEAAPPFTVPHRSTLGPATPSTQGTLRTGGCPLVPANRPNPKVTLSFRPVSNPTYPRGMQGHRRPARSQQPPLYPPALEKLPVVG